jgi:hypothetical protein
MVARLNLFNQLEPSRHESLAYVLTDSNIAVDCT